MINNENGQNDIKLIKIDEEVASIKRREEIKSYVIFVINQFIWAIQGLQLKSFFYFFSKDYDTNSFIFYRHLGVSLAGYLSIKYKKINMKYPSQITYKIWFYIRNIGIYICIFTWMSALGIFRLSTCQILGGLGPFLTILFLIIFLNEKFHKIYAYGIAICFIGSSMIILNERKAETSTEKDSSMNNLFLGSFYLTINITLFSLGLVGQKFLCNENLSPEEQTFYFGFYSVIIAGIFCIINLDFKLSNILYSLYSLLNGFIFYLCNYFNSVSFKLTSQVSKLQPVNYLSTVLIVISSAIVFKEKLYFTDILGATMIIGFIIYNGMNPPK